MYPPPVHTFFLPGIRQFARASSSPVSVCFLSFYPHFSHSTSRFLCERLAASCDALLFRFALAQSRRTVATESAVTGGVVVSVVGQVKDRFTVALKIPSTFSRFRSHLHSVLFYSCPRYRSRSRSCLWRVFGLIRSFFCARLCSVSVYRRKVTLSSATSASREAIIAALHCAVNPFKLP